MDKELLRRYLNDDSFKAVAVVVGNKKIISTLIMKMKSSSIHLRIARELSHLAQFLI